jgi:hypothetical protein
MNHQSSINFLRMHEAIQNEVDPQIKAREIRHQATINRKQDER